MSVGEGVEPPKVSPRTAEQPMAFETHEFLYGVWRAWLLFQCIAPVLVAVTLAIPSVISDGEGANPLSYVGASISIMFLAGIWGLPTTVVAVLVGAGPAYLLGRALRRIDDELIHIVVFAIYGLIVGAATVIAFSTFMMFNTATGSGAFEMQVLWAVLAIAAGVAVPFGQYKAMRRALRADAEESFAAAGA